MSPPWPAWWPARRWGSSPSPSSAEAPQATGWWSRRLPLQGEVEGASARPAVRYTPQQELPIDPTDPVGGPVTTLPLPVPVPTIPVPPVTLPPDPGPGTPNPTVPDGGLWVANDPTGAVAISAIRYRGDIGTGELKLDFAPGSTTVGAVIACPALSEFTPGPNGAWADRPAHDCERMALTGRLSSDATSMQFTIPQGFVPFGERVLDIVLLPDPSRGDVFSLYFQKPDENSLDVSQGQELPPPVDELPDPEPASLPAPIDDSSGGFDSGGFDSPTDVASPSTPSVPTEQADPSPLVPKPIAGFLEPFTESRTGRIIAVMVLLGLGAGLWLFGGQPIRQPRLLGALADDTPALVDVPTDSGRGIGRFRRDRSSPPGRL